MGSGGTGRGSKDGLTGRRRRGGSRYLKEEEDKEV